LCGIHAKLAHANSCLVVNCQTQLRSFFIARFTKVSGVSSVRTRT
jgi:hypothetical protein